MKKIIQSVFTGSTDRVFIQLIRYTFVGGVAFLADMGTLVALTEFVKLDYLISAAVAFMTGLVINYFISTKWVFSARTLSNRKLEFLFFTLIGIIGLLINEAIMWGFTEIVLFHYTLSKICSAFVVYLWNFLARRFLLFK
ncbi:MAG: GtrA family protein [Deltaproteobacteria bacterium]|nr:GtrA family protein [Deltaproteobacteria bacterium]